VADALAGLEASQRMRERKVAGREIATGVSQLLMGAAFDGCGEEHGTRKARGLLDGEEKRGADEHRTSNAQH
jgi:hypothetical protein